MQTKIYFIIMLLCFSISTQAQILNKLKEKKKEVEQKIDNKINEKVGDILKTDKNTPTTKTSPNTSDNQNKSLSTGSISIRHTNGMPTVNISEIGTVTVTEYADSTVISGSWWTHGVDIDDKFRLVFYQKASNYGQGFETNKNYSISAQKVGLFLAYDVANGGKTSSPSSQYQNYWLKSGSITLNRLDDESIHFSFSGVGRIGTLSVEHSADHGDIVVADKSDILVNGAFSIKGFATKKGYAPKTDVADNAQENIPNTGKAKSANLRGQYQFDGVIEHEIVDGKGETFQYSYLYSKNETYVGIGIDMAQMGQSGDAVTVYDNDNAVNFINVMGFKMCTALQNSMRGFENPQEKYDNTKLSKTGKTKTILDYNCTEYVMKDEANNSEVRAWVAETLDVPWMNINSDVKMPFKGYILEYHSTDGKETAIIKTTGIHLNKTTTINSSEYQKRF